MTQPKTKEEILKELISLQDNICIGIPEDATMETSFEDLDADSLDMVELQMEVEKHFHISLDDQLLKKTNTVGDMVEAIDAELNKVFTENL